MFPPDREEVTGSVVSDHDICCACFSPGIPRVFMALQVIQEIGGWAMRIVEPGFGSKVIPSGKVEIVNHENPNGNLKVKINDEWNIMFLFNIIIISQFLPSTIGR